MLEFLSGLKVSLDFLLMAAKNKTALGVLLMAVSLGVLVISASFFYFTQPNVLKANVMESLQMAYQANPPPDKIENLIEESNGKQFIERKSMSGYAFKFYSDKIRASTQQTIGAYLGSELFSQGYYRNFPTEKASVFELAMSQYGNNMFMLISIISFLFSAAGAAIYYVNKKKIYEISKYLGISIIIASLPVLLIPHAKSVLNLPDATGIYSTTLQYFLSPFMNLFVSSYAVSIVAGLFLLSIGAYVERKTPRLKVQKPFIIDIADKNN